MDTYNYIIDKIKGLKTQYQSLRARTDDYVFSALCIKANFYKSPSLVLNESDFVEMIVDSPHDGGADILLSDPNSENSDLVIGQAKLYKSISYEQVLNAVRKMADFYKDMRIGHYERFNDHVRSRFRKLYSEIGDESKIHFVLYISAPKNKINVKRIKQKFREFFNDTDEIELEIFFADDIVDEIKESILRKPVVEYGKILIDDKNNYLEYGDKAIIVNVSAFSIKELYDEHNIVLLSQNLRYHIKGKMAGADIDKAIRTTIKEDPASFWFKNNGITIICNKFEFDGCVVKLWDFSIVNGGQTTWVIHRNENIDKKNFFWLPCKIIKTVGETADEKTNFSLAIAQAANSQKPIQPADLKANSPEQQRFAQAMKNVEVLYITKRGEEIGKKYRNIYHNTNLSEIGKLCLAAIFQEPGKSKNKPSESYNDPKYYNPIFRSNSPEQIAGICKELLYIDYYFDKIFQPKFERENKTLPDSATKTKIANNARRICIAFTTLAARYHQGNITDQKLKMALESAQSDSHKANFYNVFRDLGDMKTLLPMKLYTDAYNAALDKLFKAIIKAGTKTYSYELKHDEKLEVRNFLLRDKNYYGILNDHWDTLRDDIQEIFSAV